MDSLYILWTNADPLTCKHMVCMYACNSKINGWWDKVTVIIWGATAQLIKENSEIRDEIEHIMGLGVKVIACKACADRLDTSQTLEHLGIKVEYLGVYLTDVIKDPEKHLITV